MQPASGSNLVARADPGERRRSRIGAIIADEPPAAKVTWSDPGEGRPAPGKRRQMRNAREVSAAPAVDIDGDDLGP
jgi:hypothetical protein